jgi:hypothetical protein
MTARRHIGRSRAMDAFNPAAAAAAENPAANAAIL